MRRHVAALVLAGACLPLTAAACGGDDEPSEAQGTTTTSAAETTASPTTLTKEQEVEAAYYEWVTVMLELGPAPNPDDPRLPELVLEPQLTQIRDGLAQRISRNQVYERSEESSEEIIDTVIASAGTSARVTACSVGADRLIDRDTGDVVSEGTATLENEVTLRHESGRWKIEDIRTVRTWDGVAQCDA